MSAVGQVIIGYSNPWVALYSATGTTVTYSGHARLARGVSVAYEPDENGDNIIFRADNVNAETARTPSTGGSLTVSCDQPIPATEAMIMGVTAGTDGSITYTADQTIPYVAHGGVVKYMSDGEISYKGYLFHKCVFSPLPLNAETEGEEISFQPGELSATVMPSDNATRDILTFTGAYSTEASAEAAMLALTGYTG